MEKLLVISCVSDDRFAPISMYLMKNHLQDVKEGVAKYASNGFGSVMYLLPEGENVEGIDAEVKHSICSPVLNNPYAIAQVLIGNLPRPMIQDDFVAEYDGKEISVITPEVAYGIKNGFDDKFVAVNAEGKTEVKKAKVGDSLTGLADFTDAKAILLGGFKGGFEVPSKIAELKIEGTDRFSSITIYGKQECMVDVCKQLYNMAYECSCGKCVLCREGTSQFRQIVTEMTTGKAKISDVEMIKDVSSLISIGAYCPFGQNMTGPLTSALELFADEFEGHIRKKECKCGKCYKAEETYVIMPDLCTGCGDCIDECPEEAIEGKDGYIHMIDQDLCEHCGKCVKACDEDAIVVVTGKLPKLPRKLTKVGKW